MAPSMEPSPGPARRAAPWAALTAAAVLVAFAPALRADRTLSRRDTAILLEPVRPLIVEALRAGRLPLWNPYEATGKPLLGDGLHGVLHPVSVAGALLAPDSTDFLLLAHLVCAALGAFALARTLGASPAAAAGAGVAFATSGFVASMTGIATFLAGAGALAWMLAAARWAGAGAPLGAAACAASTALAFLSGDTQMALVGGVLGGALALEVGGWRRLPRVLVGMGAGALAAGVQIAASWGALRHSTRALPLTAADRGAWALHPLRLVEWLVPGLATGGPGAFATVDLVGTPELPGAFSESVYLGVVLLALAAVGVAAAGRRTRLLLAASAALLLWIALGHRLGARQLLDLVPVWSRFRYTEKLMAPLTLVLCAAAALGADRLGRARLPAAARVVLCGIAAAAGAALAGVALAPDAARALLEGLAGGGGEFLAGVLRRGLPHAALGAAALLAADRLVPAGRAEVAAALLALSTAAGLGAAVSYGSAAAHAVQPALRLPPEPAGPLRLAHPVSRDVLALGELAPLDANLALRRLASFPALNVESRVDTLGQYGTFVSLRVDELSQALGARWWQAGRRFALTHVVVLPPASEPQARTVAAAIQGGSLAFERRLPPLQAWAVPHRPWAFFADAVVIAGDAPARVAELVARGDDGTVVLAAGPPPPTAPGAVLSTRRGVEELRIEAEAASDALLVVNDAWWPGWRARLDGREVPVLPADHLVRAVAFPAGRHAVEMSYAPPELRAGWALTVAGLALTVLLAALGLRRRAARG